MRLFDILYEAQKRYGDKVAFVTTRQGEQHVITYNQYLQEAEYTALWLESLNVKPGDRVINLLVNSDDWNVLDMGVQLLGGVQVAVFLNYNTDDYKKILSETEARVAVVANPITRKLLESIKDDLPALKHIFTADEFRIARNNISHKNRAFETLRENAARIRDTELYSIYYTSGTRDTANGVMVTHRAVIKCLRFLREAYGFTQQDAAVSYLPLAHSYERAHNYVYQMCGMRVTYAENAQSVVGNLQQTSPTFFTTVPVLLENLYRNLPIDDLETSIKKFVALTGGRIRIISSAGAPLPEHLFDFFTRMGVLVMECYGTTETQIICLNRLPGGIVPGTVGEPSPHVQVKLADDGEILLKSEYMMQGYYRNPVLTAAVFDQEGWYKTGDLGRWVNQTHLKITGRKRDVFKAAHGRYISPEAIEKQLLQIKGILQVMVYPQNGHVNALVVLEPSTSVGEVHVKACIDEYNSQQPVAEQVVGVQFLSVPWTIENGELTPTMKLKRQVILARYST